MAKTPQLAGMFQDICDRVETLTDVVENLGDVVELKSQIAGLSRGYASLMSDCEMLRRQLKDERAISEQLTMANALLRTEIDLLQARTSEASDAEILPNDDDERWPLGNAENCAHPSWHLDGDDDGARVKICDECGDPIE